MESIASIGRAGRLPGRGDGGGESPEPEGEESLRICAPGADGGSIAGADLRRRRQREVAEMLCRRAEYLPLMDRTLVQVVYGDGRTVAEIARIRGQRPEDVRRRLRLVVKRISTAPYEYVGAARAAWPPKMRAVATEYFLNGRTMRQIARDLRTSLHDVRRHRDAVLALVEEWSHRPVASIGPRRRRRKRRGESGDAA